MYSDGPHLYINVSVWNGPIHPWLLRKASIDSNEKLHGQIILTLPEQFHNQTGVHNFLGWSPITINGRFQHGCLDGYAAILTWKGEAIFLQAQKGILHGPAISNGLVPVLDYKMRNYKLKHKVLLLFCYKVA